MPNAGETKECRTAYAKLVSNAKGEITVKQLAEVAIRLYNCGYNAGHHDTVEGFFTTILDVDIATYHSDVVDEILDEILTDILEVSNA